MEYLILVFIVVFILAFANIANRAQISEQKPVRLEKACPPHKWSWKDQLGGGQFISCDLCKMVPGSATYTPRNPNDNEY